MMSVHEVSKKTGVSIRTLHYYDEIGLLCPTSVSEAGYRFYDETALERLQQIMLFKELEFPLKQIKQIIDSKNFDRQKALSQQIELLTLKKEHLEKIIDYARKIKLTGDTNMNFEIFDTKKIDEYAKRAKEQWQHTDAYKEYEQRKSKNTASQNKEFMNLFTEFGLLMSKKPQESEVQSQVRKLKDYITDNYYNCTNEILSSLGNMYVNDSEFTKNIDAFGGSGCAEFVNQAIQIYCMNLETE